MVWRHVLQHVWLRPSLAVVWHLRGTQLRRLGLRHVTPFSLPRYGVLDPRHTFEDGSTLGAALAGRLVVVDPSPATHAIAPQLKAGEAEY